MCKKTVLNAHQALFLNYGLTLIDNEKLKVMDEMDYYCKDKLLLTGFGTSVMLSIFYSGHLYYPFTSVWINIINAMFTGLKGK